MLDLSTDDVGRFETLGFLELGNSLFAPELITRAAAAAEESADEPAKHRAHGSSHGHFDFPFPPGTAEQPLNALTLDDGARAAVCIVSEQQFFRRLDCLMNSRIVLKLALDFN